MKRSEHLSANNNKLKIAEHGLTKAEHGSFTLSTTTLVCSTVLANMELSPD
jgi:hypothetical protein